MSKLENDLKLAHDLIEDKEKYREYYWQFYRMWPFTTINMKEELHPFDLKEKKCVMIQGSSDHVFEMALKKPKQIIGVDTNPLTEYYCYLKLAAFAALATPEEFLKFFRWYDYPETYRKNKEAFDKDIFKDISRHLMGDGKLFWEDLFSTYDPILIRKMLFSNDEEENDILYGALNYLSKDNYEYLRKNWSIINFKFLNSDIRTINQELEDDIDFIDLSNLIIYEYDMFPDNRLSGYKKLIERLADKLKSGGQIMAGYLYDIENEEDGRQVYNSRLRDSVFTGPEYSYNYITKIQDLAGYKSENHDACLIYTKK